MESSGYKIIVDPEYGYLRLDPVPCDVSKLYEDDYYNLISQDGRASELLHLMKGGEEATRELKWLQATLYEDIVDMMRRHSPNVRVLDIGCGTGEFAAYLKGNGFEVLGIDPSLYATQQALTKGLRVQQCTLEGFGGEEGFGTVLMLNVLKHVPDAPAFVNRAKSLLAPNGVLCIRVPNDFNTLKMAVQTSLKKSEWWISIPDHINYFNFGSLLHFLERLDLESIETQSDFPMELFLLMGHDYTEHADIGDYCHARRVHLELSIPREVRRSLYRALAKAGIGGNCLVFCRRGR